MKKEKSFSAKKKFDANLSFFLSVPSPLWFRTTQNWEVSTGSLARLFTPLLTPLTHSALLPLLAYSSDIICLLAHSLTHSLTHSLVRDQLSQHQAVLNYSALHPFYALTSHCPFKSTHVP